MKRITAENKALLTEKDTLKGNLKKLKARKIVDVNAKLCVNCGRDFNEKTNMAWSCRTHKYDYNGAFWWCCLKKDNNAIGCIVKRHTVKDNNKYGEEDFKNII